MSHPLVSIIINCYNSDQYLIKAIQSIFNQSYKEWEIIFWDNASTDNSADIAKSFGKKLKYFKSQKNTNLGKARKEAILKASGDYIAFLDCDDEWLKNKLSTQVQALEENKNYSFCYGGVHYINQNNKPILDYLPKARSGYVLPLQLSKYEIGIQSVLIRKGTDLDFNPDLEFSPDYDLLMNIASKYKAYVINDYLINYRIVSESLTSKKIDIWWIEMKYTLDHIIQTNPSLLLKYPKEFKKAYAKVNYLKAKLFFSNNQNLKAIKTLSEYKFVSTKYFGLFIISIFGKNFWNFVQNKINILERAQK
tara:strand:- start:11462 stop:12382 length:921 start_codon:yes stop_codon:yes gene_type:complete